MAEISSIQLSLSIKFSSYNDTMVICKTAACDEIQTALRLFISINNVNNSSEWMCVKDTQFGLEETCRVPSAVIAMGHQYNVSVKLMKEICSLSKAVNRDLYYEKLAETSAPFSSGNDSFVAVNMILDLSNCFCTGVSCQKFINEAYQNSSSSLWC
jgi:hypothetical protein